MLSVCLQVRGVDTSLVQQLGQRCGRLALLLRASKFYGFLLDITLEKAKKCLVSRLSCLALLSLGHKVVIFRFNVKVVFSTQDSLRVLSISHRGLRISSSEILITNGSVSLVSLGFGFVVLFRCKAIIRVRCHQHCVFVLNRVESHFLKLLYERNLLDSLRLQNVDKGCVSMLLIQIQIVGLVLVDTWSLHFLLLRILLYMVNQVLLLLLFEMWGKHEFIML